MRAFLLSSSVLGLGTQRGGLELLGCGFIQGKEAFSASVSHFGFGRRMPFKGRDPLFSYGTLHQGG